MRPIRLALGTAAALVLIGGIACTTAPNLRNLAVTPQPMTCHASGPLPDATCTPGATNPDVTQATIGQTICVRGWTATVRPPVSVTDPIKVERMAAYGVGTDKTVYELDHLIPLELGGAPNNTLNFWPEPWNGLEGAHTKDKVENAARAAVCSGGMTLVDAQTEMARDWTALCRELKADQSC